ncbi:MAG: hypothetical protein ACRDOO_00680 [Actinomadura sp.]
MTVDDPRIQVAACLAELSHELESLGVPVTTVRDPDGRACLEAKDRWGRARRIYVFTQFFWFIWGVHPDERHSVFQVGETAVRLARLAGGQGWPSHEADLGELARTLDMYLP